MACSPRARLRALLLATPFVFSVSVGAPPALRAQPPSEGSATPVRTRACTANPVLAPAGKQKSHHKTKHPLPPAPLPACMEIQGAPLEIQETFQSIARQQKWRMHESHATEDSWTFVRYLNTDELEKYADTKILIEPLNFEDGKAAVMVRTVDLGGGFVRVQVSAQFEGEGKSADPTFKQPATSWPVATKGLLEKEMLAMLAAGYQHLE